MSNLKRYPDYKDSGVPWLGDIPSHWEVIDSKFILNFSRGLTITKSNLIDEGIPCVNYGEVHSKYGFEIDPQQHKLKCVPKAYLEQFEYAILNRGDFIFADTSEDYAGSGNFTYLNSDTTTFAGYHTIVARLKFDYNPRYLAYVFDSNEFRTQVKVQVSGVKVFSITHNILKNASVWLPPTSEQELIVSFLDKRLSHIDTLISKQKQLLEKLAEQRSAVITHVVTKGLNPDVPMKDSGVEWLGNIPEHWNISKLKYLVSCNDETLNENTDPTYEFQYVDISSVSLFEGITNKEDLVFYDSPSRARRIVKQGDVIVSTVRTYLKAIAQVDECQDNLIVSTGFAVLRPQTELLPKFLGYWVQSDYLVSNIMSNSVGVSYPAINSTDLVRLPIVQVSRSEQEEIVTYLDNETYHIDQMINATKNIIGKLNEYRSALITQAVTGKIDVRDTDNQAVEGVA